MIGQLVQDQRRAGHLLSPAVDIVEDGPALGALFGQRTHDQLQGRLAVREQRRETQSLSRQLPPVLRHVPGGLVTLESNGGEQRIERSLQLADALARANQLEEPERPAVRQNRSQHPVRWIVPRLLLGVRQLPLLVVRLVDVPVLGDRVTLDLGRLFAAHQPADTQENERGDAWGTRAQKPATGMRPRELGEHR